MSSNQALNESEFAERIAKIRARFASKLADKIEATDAAMVHMGDDASDAIDAVATTYRRFHDMYGISSTIGFKAIGQMARTVDAVLIGPYRDRRGLREDELAKLKRALEALQAAAATELQITGKDQESES
jgi:chemotaxis protein histidine kinase CheA